MSGGVDSSVVAALLVQQGYDVTGAYMRQWDDSKELSGVCSWKEDRRDAMRVAAKLGISLLTFDFIKEYQDFVMDYMFAEYKKGRTPNPDVMCNKYIKFGFWLKKAKELGYDAIATGHYCSLEEKDGNYHLMQAKDENKDQTYFLHQLNQEQLSKTLFPLGEYCKDEVRKLAVDFELPTANRAESMGICFIGEVPMKEFLGQKIKPEIGNIVLSTGENLGKHDGLPFYTIGQRNLGINSPQNTEENKPLYVVGKNSDENELIVGFEDDPLLFREKIELDDMHFVRGEAPELPFDCEVRLRHRQKLQAATFLKEDEKDVLVFKEKQRAVTPGQFAVLYIGGECFGGGVVI
jgi:tRNA-uridine 2-sulfurtransferase